MITSFLQGKASPTTTSTIFNPYVDPATVANKTGYYNVSPGAIPDTNRPQIKTAGGRIIRVLNDLLPYRIRPIKSKRRYIRKGYTLLVEIYTFRMVWRSHYKPYLKRKIKMMMNKK